MEDTNLSTSLFEFFYKNIEVILVDDESPDLCGKICDDYVAMDGRIKVVHKKNGGLSDARNAGMKVATGDLITFVDSDDYISKDFVKILFEAMSENNSDIAIANMKRTSRRDDKNTVIDWKVSSYKNAVYQLKESAELAAYRSRSYQYLTEHHFQVIIQNYQQAYFNKLFTSDTPEMIRKRLEEHRPKNFRGRPFGVGDVIVINQQGEITAYFVDKDSLVVVAGFVRSSSSGILVTLDTKNLFIDGCAGTWMATEECVVESQHFFLMQHEVYKEKAPNVIVDASGKLVSTEIRKGVDEDARKKILDYLHGCWTIAVQKKSK